TKSQPLLISTSTFFFPERWQQCLQKPGGLLQGPSFSCHPERETKTLENFKYCFNFLQNRHRRSPGKWGAGLHQIQGTLQGKNDWAHSSDYRLSQSGGSGTGHDLEEMKLLAVATSGPRCKDKFWVPSHTPQDGRQCATARETQSCSTEPEDKLRRVPLKSWNSFTSLRCEGCLPFLT
ncbi:hypothetical protein LEMLEM_LOCUS14407, partial [Lemmus lemmus]